MRKITAVLIVLCAVLSFTACTETNYPEVPSNGDVQTETEKSEELETVKDEQGKVSDKMQMKIGDTVVDVKWEYNDSVRALEELTADAPLTIQMSMYGGFEQVGPIGQNLPISDSQTTTSAGDIVLYSGNQIVVFYGSNSWSYTRLGSITDKTSQELRDMLGRGNVTITIGKGL